KPWPKTSPLASYFQTFAASSLLRARSVGAGCSPPPASISPADPVSSPARGGFEPGMSGEKMAKASSRVWRWSCLPIAWAIIGCAGAVQQKTPPPPGPTGTVAAFVTDAPANGVVSISLLVSGASLADSAGANTSIVSSTAQPEFRHLELAPTVMVQAPNIPTGSYSSLALTLANPQISISDS